MSGRAVVIGAGLGGLSAAALLAKDGWDVIVLEKNAAPGGRARVWSLSPSALILYLGLSHTLFQTAAFRPHRRSRRVSNLHYTGQYTHPGVGMPMVFIAAELTAGRIAHEQR